MPRLRSFAAFLLLLGACAAPLAPLPPADTRVAGFDPAPPEEGPPAQASAAPSGASSGPPAAIEPPPTEAGKKAVAALRPAPVYDQEKLAALRARLTRLLKGAVTARGAVGAAVIEVSSGAVIFEREADKAMIPASNEKLFTTAASIDLLGPDHRTMTSLFASSRAAPDGSVEDLYLRGDHDLGWSSPDHAPPAALLRLAQAARSQGIVKVRGRLHLYGEMIIDAERFGTLDVAAHQMKVGRRFQKILADAGISFGATGISVEGSFSLPKGLVELGSEPSDSLIHACATINQLSHNEMADALLRHLGHTRGNQLSYQAGAAEVMTWLGAVGLPTAGMQIADGSGLSRDNHTTPRALVGLLGLAARSSWGDAFAGTLAVAGEAGTLAHRMDGPDTTGRVRGKTGTLDGVVSLSGYLKSRYDDRLYAFSLIFNGIGKKGAATRKVEDAFVTALASDWQGKTP